MNAKHNSPSVDKSGEVSSSRVVKTAEEILHPLHFKKLIKKSIDKVVNDGK